MRPLSPAFPPCQQPAEVLSGLQRGGETGAEPGEAAAVPGAEESGVSVTL